MDKDEGPPAVTGSILNNAGDTGGRPRRMASAELFGDANKIEITHEGVIYLLRITKNGKLILTK